MKTFWSALPLAGLCMALAAPLGARADAPLKPCRVPGIETEVQCGVLPRALDPAQPAGVKIDIHYVVVPALARRKLPDPVFLLAGGPGQSAIAVAPIVMRQMSRLGNRRDLVFVDQRGTGKSAPLMCAEDRAGSLAQQLDPRRRESLLRQCLAELQKLPYGDLRFFTTSLAMQDVDAVRQALGAPRINLVGASYGTRATLEYMRQFPQSVRRSVMDGVAPPDMVLPDSVSGDNQVALDAVLAACEAQAECQRSYPAVRTEWADLLARLPQDVVLAHPLTGERQPVRITREGVLALVRGPLYAPALAAALPYAVQEAARGRFEALLGLSTMLGGRGPNRLAQGMHFSVVCAEDRPRPGGASATPGVDFGQTYAELYEQPCAYWPRSVVPQAFYTVPPGQTAALVLSGGLDPVTPPRHGARVAQALGAKAKHVVVPHAGHGVMSLACMRDVLFRFIDAPDDAAALAVDASCAVNIPRPSAFVPVQPIPTSTP
ncbi:alpha/beta hydrolase [Rhodoferax sp.]|uniref:alpha/beta hydrolase n=1 Tax=Rhodoferax sp. TaxID=50421 RepID=UPI0027448623|nr:alpha/beta hydrolase [Rhodoferax sp.]